MTVGRNIVAPAALAAAVLGAPLTAQTFEISPPASEAARLFQKVCVANRNRLAGGIEALEKLGFIFDPGQEIHFHPTYDLSFSIQTQPGEGRWYCSMVWSSVDPLPVNAAAIAGMAPDAAEPDFFNSDLMRTRIYGSY